MRSWEVIQHCVEESGKTVPEIANAMRDPSIRLRVQPSMIDGWLSEPKAAKDGDFLQRAAKLVRQTKCLLPAQWVCAQLGAFFVFDSTAFDRKALLLPNWYQVMKELHELRAAIVSAYDDDHQFNRDETRSIGIAWADVLAWTEGFTSWSEGKPPHVPAYLSFKPTASLPFLESHHAIRNAYAARQSCGTKMLVDSMGLSLSMLQKWGEPPGSTAAPLAGSANPFDYLINFARATGNILPVQWLCHACDGFLAQDDIDLPPDERTLVSSWQSVHCELAELDFVITAAVQDGKIDHAESPRIRAEWEDAKKWMRGFVQSCHATAQFRQNPLSAQAHQAVENHARRPPVRGRTSF
jgi:hypothetical protein